MTTTVDPQVARQREYCARYRARKAAGVTAYADAAHARLAATALLQRGWSLTPISRSADCSPATVRRVLDVDGCRVSREAAAGLVWTAWRVVGHR